jgi:hypothetical protein
MCVLLLLSPGRQCGLGGVLKLIEDGSVESLGAAALGLGELVRDGHLLEVDESLADGLEAAFEGDRHGGDRLRRLGLETALGVAEQLAAVLVVGDTIGGNQGDGFVTAEPMAVEGIDEGVLVALVQGAERVSEGGAELCLSQLLLCRGAEEPADVDAAGYPARALAQQPGDLGLGLTVLVDERADDPRLVEGGDGARRGVGAEQEALVLFDPRRSFDHDGHELTALLSPPCQALEAVDDLVGAVVGGRDAQGQLGPLVDPLSRRAHPQRPVGGPQQGDGYVLDGARNCGALLLGSHGSPLPWRRCRWQRACSSSLVKGARPSAALSPGCRPPRGPARDSPRP